MSNRFFIAHQESEFLLFLVRLTFIIFFNIFFWFDAVNGLKMKTTATKMILVCWEYSNTMLFLYFLQFFSVFSVCVDCFDRYIQTFFFVLLSPYTNVSMWNVGEYNANLFSWEISCFIESRFWFWTNFCFWTKIKSFSSFFPGIRMLFRRSTSFWKFANEKIKSLIEIRNKKSEDN